MTPHKNRLAETVLMMGHKIYFYREIWLIIPKMSLLLLLIWSTGPLTSSANKVDPYQNALQEQSDQSL